MEGQPIQVDINQESKEIRKNELYDVGDRMERAMVEGESIFLERDDLLWLRVMVEKTGINLGTIEGKASLAEQAGQLVMAIGVERLLRMMPELMAEIINCPAGEVFKREDERPENTKEMIGEFVTEYLRGQIENGRFVFDPLKIEEGWKRNSVYRIEAVMAVMNKLLWVMKSEDEYEDFRRQSTDGVLKHLRERVMRGAERAGEVIDQRATRSEEKIIRHLPPKSVGVVLEHLTRV